MSHVCIFGIPKPSNAVMDKIQENAVYSWICVSSGVILCGNDGVGLSERMNTDWTCVQTNEYGTPLVNDAFKKACEMSSDEYLMYSNCDMVYVHNLNLVATRVNELFSDFLVVGRRIDVAGVPSPVNDSKWWEDRVVEIANESGKLHIWSGIDYFLFNRELIEKLDIPPFAVGRVAWDNWMIGRAKQLGIPVIDATSSILAVHQNHSYDHVTGGHDWVRNGPEARENRRLAAGVPALTIKDADHKVGNFL